MSNMKKVQFTQHSLFVPRLFVSRFRRRVHTGESVERMSV